jgi:hypothetical protein
MYTKSLLTGSSLAQNSEAEHFNYYRVFINVLLIND